MEPGDKLPTAREVVEATAINPNTVLKAHRELEREGLVEARAAGLERDDVAALFTAVLEEQFTEPQTTDRGFKGEFA